LAAKRLQLLKEAVPSLTHVAMLGNATNPATPFSIEETQAVGPAMGVQVTPILVQAADELEHAFIAINGASSQGLLTVSDAMLFQERARIAGLTVRYRLPALFPEKEFVQAGGLICYGASVRANFHSAASYVDKILKGVRPDQLPVQQPSQFDFVINLGA